MLLAGFAYVGVYALTNEIQAKGAGTSIERVADVVQPTPIPEKVEVTVIIEGLGNDKPGATPTVEGDRLRDTRGETIPDGVTPDIIDPWQDLGVMAEDLPSAGSGEKMTFKVTHYWPIEGGDNCYRFVNGKCTSKTSSGVPWETAVGYSAACPWDWPMFSTFEIGGRFFLCLDRGSMICQDGICHVDILTDRGVDGLYTGHVWIYDR